MKVLLLNGSPHKNGCTYTALSEAASQLAKHNIETEIIQIGSEAIRGCTACGACRGKGLCVYDDIVNEVIEKAKTADGFLVGSPVYYASPNGTLISFLDRLFFAGSYALAYKPAASVVSARRGGTTASFEVLNKYFMMTNMPVVTSQYWNMVHGSCAEDVQKDEEGLQTMRRLADNMAWLLKCIEAGKAQGITPAEPEPVVRTNFIR
ncbi:MAG: flavodoxin family protein [Lachnospiraceae bacterium]|nr:flavodoxin family protein [Lachnospiraceae bacterium]